MLMTEGTLFLNYRPFILLSYQLNTPSLSNRKKRYHGNRQFLFPWPCDGTIVYCRPWNVSQLQLSGPIKNHLKSISHIINYFTNCSRQRDLLHETVTRVGQLIYRCNSHIFDGRSPKKGSPLQFFDDHQRPLSSKKRGRTGILIILVVWCSWAKWRIAELSPQQRKDEEEGELPINTNYCSV